MIEKNVLWSYTIHSVKCTLLSEQPDEIYIGIHLYSHCLDQDEEYFQYYKECSNARS